MSYISIFEEYPFENEMFFGGEKLDKSLPEFWIMVYYPYNPENKQFEIKKTFNYVHREAVLKKGCEVYLKNDKMRNMGIVALIADNQKELKDCFECTKREMKLTYNIISIQKIQVLLENIDVFNKAAEFVNTIRMHQGYLVADEKHETKRSKLESTSSEAIEEELDNWSIFSVEDNKEIIEIGKGGTKIPLTVYNNIEWTKYTLATRKLLENIFSQKELATHSLSGKPSPAFRNRTKIIKKKLDPIAVKDVIEIVAKMCRVPENLVRNSITRKCADESKNLKCKQRKKKPSDREE